jgi:hypothetical protein
MYVSLRPAPLFLVHVPKAGGHTIDSWLRRFYLGNDIQLKPKLLAELTADELRRRRYFHSWHFGRGMLDLIQRPDIPVVTVLREPIERDLSQLEHHRRALKRFPKAHDPQDYARIQPLLDSGAFDWFITNRDSGLVGNRQTHILGTRTDYSPLLKGNSHAGRHQDWPVPPPHPELPIDPDEQLREAKAWLDRMAVVGINERFRESMLLIADAFGFPVLREFGHRNVNPQRTARSSMRYQDAINPDQRAELAAANQRDFELYAYAVERFERDWSRFQARPQRHISIAAYAARARDVVHYRVQRLVRC